MHRLPPTSDGEYKKTKHMATQKPAQFISFEPGCYCAKVLTVLHVNELC